MRSPLHSTLFILVPSSGVFENSIGDPLHSTLFILVHSGRIRKYRQLKLYIPLCLYQYGEQFAIDQPGKDSTFHSVYISTRMGWSGSNPVWASTFHSVYISTRRYKK